MKEVSKALMNISEKVSQLAQAIAELAQTTGPMRTVEELAKELEAFRKSQTRW